MRWCLLIVLAAMMGCDNRPAPSGDTKSDATNSKPERPALADSQAKIALNTVTLYASGVARMEHKGTVSGDATIELAFKGPQASAVLKSMMVEDGANVLIATTQPADQDRKTVSVRLRGKGDRPVRIGYTLEAQPWKVSYRLLLSDKPSLQGWASVSNDTETDWTGVQLNLMCGRPFLLAQDNGVDASAAARAARGAGIPAGESFRRPRPVPSREAIDDDPSPTARENAERTLDGPVVSAKEAFRYTLADVTIQRQSCANVQIMNEAIALEPVAVYNETLLRRNALLGARIHNTSKHHLLQGSVTVMDDGQYAGDASMENLAPGRSCLVLWGIDLPVLVDSSELVPGTSIESAAIDAGVLRLERRHVYSRHYVMENEDQKDRTLIIEHPIRRGWRLLQPAEPMQATETVYRFRQPLPAASKARLVVKEMITEADDVDLATADVETVASFSRDAEVPPAIREALVKMVPLLTDMASKPDAAREPLAASIRKVNVAKALRPLRRTIPIPPAPGGVEMAMIVSSSMRGRFPAPHCRGDNPISK